ncbi:MAG TPA: metal ABC transporter permease [Solirubrobacteraceae bacterium]
MPMPADASSPHLSWNAVSDVRALLEYHFMVNALLAGALVAIMAGAAGWMMVLRRETFAGHTLAMMAFPGAAAAALIGIPAAWGYFAFCGLGALAIGRLFGRGPGAWSEQSAGIGAVQAAALAAGFLFVSLYGGVLGDLESQLFGTFLGISDGHVLALAALAAAVLLVLAALGRPLLFASVDGEVAGARGVPVAALSGAFLLLLGLTVAATSQITGVLLVLALLVGPAASAQAITARPGASLALTLVFGLFVAWLGLALSYFSVYPAGFFIATVAFVVYLLARLLGALAPHRRAPAAGTAEPAAEGVIA